MSEPDHNPFAAPQSENLVAMPAGHVDFEALRTTGNGLRLIYFSLLLLVLLVFTVFGVTFFAKRSPGPSQSGLAVLVVTGIGVLLVAVMSLIGGIMCVTVPRESDGKGFATASVAIQGVNLLIMFSGIFLGFVLGNMIASLLNVMSLISFLLFLRCLSSFIHRDDLRRRASRLVTFVLIYGTAIIAAAVSPILGALNYGLVVGLIGGVGALVLFVMFANLVHDLSKAIRHPESSSGDTRGYV